MTRTMHIVIFLGMLSLLLGGAHYYVVTRLSHYLVLSGGQRKALLLCGGVMLLLTISAMPMMRTLPREFSTPLAWLVFSWVGILLVLMLIMFATDTLYLLTQTALPPADPARRLALQKMFGFAALGATGVVSGFSFWNALRPVAVKPVSITLNRLPAALDGLRIVQLTDLHLGPTIDGAWLRQVVEKTNALNPDIVAITGDLVDGSVAELGGAASALRDLRAKHGVFFVTGNHEYYSGVEPWVEFLRTLDIRVLRNEYATLDIGGQSLDLAGVEDYGSGNGDLPKALAGRDAARPVILLAHQPAAVKEAALHQVDLQLSGHTHGGQVWPWQYLVLLQQPYVSGLHRHPGSDTQIYVSDGTGYWGPPMRLGTAAEITEITLHAPA